MRFGWASELLFCLLQLYPKTPESVMAYPIADKIETWLPKSTTEITDAGTPFEHPRTCKSTSGSGIA